MNVQDGKISVEKLHKLKARWFDVAKKWELIGENEPELKSEMIATAQVLKNCAQDLHDLTQT